MESKSIPGTGTLLARLLLVVFRCWGKRDRTIWETQTLVNHVMGEMELGWMERSPRNLADIACWYKQLVHYRGYLLFASRSGWTVLIDPDYQYLQGSGSRLVHIKGIEQAKAFLDALLTAQELLVM